MAKLRPPRAHNPNLPDTASVKVDLGPNFDPMAEPPRIAYGSSTPHAQAYKAAEEERTRLAAGLPSNGAAPDVSTRTVAAPAPVRVSDLSPTEYETGDGERRSSSVAYVDEFDEELDGEAAMRAADKRAKDRIRNVEQTNEQLLKWGQEQARNAAQALGAVTQSQLDTVSSALAAAEAEAEAAEQQLVEAKSRGDVAAEVRAQRAMMKAEQRIGTLQAGKDELEQQVRQKPQPAAPPVMGGNVEAILSQWTGLMPEEKDWIRAHPEVVESQANVEKLRTAFTFAQQRGMQRGGREYFGLFNEHFGFDDARNGNGAGDFRELEEEPAPVRQPRQQQRRVSAPVSGNGAGSRDGRNLRPNQVILTPQQREMARLAGVSEADYARGVVRLQEEQRRGMYGYGPQK